MSKSRGNIVDPVKLIERYGVDALKYFLLREYSFGHDGLFTNEVMLNRMNSDLANDLGNLVSRTVSMIEQYRGGVVPGPGKEEGPDKDLKALAVGAGAKVEAHMDKFNFSQALEEIWILIRRTNKYIDETTPWILAKNEGDKERLDTVLHNLAESLRIVSVLIYPYMHTTSTKIRKQLGLWFADPVWEDALVFDVMNGEEVKKGEAIFPRMDIEKELAELDAMAGGGAGCDSPVVAEAAEAVAAQADGAGRAAQDAAAQDAAVEAAAEAVAAPREYPPVKETIEYDDFAKLDMRVGLVQSCEKHPNADKLLVFQIKMGNEERQIVSGVAEFYKPEELVGKKVIVLANLAPRKLRGLMSEGMLLFADNGERYEYLTTVAPDGEIVS